MAAMVGFVLGAVMGMALFGGLVGHALRKFLQWPVRRSYAVALVGFWPIAVYFYARNNGMTDEAWINGALIYGLGAFLAYFVLVATAKTEGNVASEGTGIRWGKVGRWTAWALFVLLAALGATFIFAAFVAVYDKTIPFFIGAVLSILAFLLWKKLTSSPLPSVSNNSPQSKKL